MEERGKVWRRDDRMIQEMERKGRGNKGGKETREHVEDKRKLKK